MYHEAVVRGQAGSIFYVMACSRTPASAGVPGDCAHGTEVQARQDARAASDAGKGVGDLGGGDRRGKAAEGGGGPGDRAVEVQSLGAMACAARGDQKDKADSC